MLLNMKKMTKLCTVPELLKKLADEEVLLTLLGHSSSKSVGTVQRFVFVRVY